MKDVCRARGTRSIATATRSA